MKKHQSDEDVTLNVTAMLDMAFQLLAFFILTFRPPPGEDQIYLKLPPAQPIAGLGGQSAGSDETKDSKDVKPTKSLTVVLNDNHTGSISEVRVGIPDPSGKMMKNVPFNDLEHELHGYFKARDDSDSGGKTAQGDFEQVIISASSTLRWDEIMKVIDLCAKFNTAKGTLPSVSLFSVGDDPSS